MPIETFLTSYLQILTTDKERIESLKSEIAQAKVDGKPTSRLYKDLVNAHEKHVKHLQEYDKWLKENKIDIQIIDEENSDNLAEEQVSFNEVEEEENIAGTDDTSDDFAIQSSDTQTQPHHANQLQQPHSKPTNKAKSRKNLKKKYKLKPYNKSP